MPNHVVNEIIFRGLTEQQRKDILAAALNDKGVVDFSVLLPNPLNIWMGSVGKVHRETFPGTALDWSTENWGTKWNAYAHLPVEITDDTLRFVFETAWSPPYGWLVALLNRFQVGFDHNWHDEGSEIGRVGRFDPDGDIFDGPKWTEKDAEGDMQRHLYKLQWGVETREELDKEHDN